MTLSSFQLGLINKLSSKFNFAICLVQPNAIGATTDSMIFPVDYLKKEIKGTGLKISVNEADKCFCIYI